MSSPSPNYTELGVQAVGLPGWTLLPGMQILHPEGIRYDDRETWPVRVLTVEPYRAVGVGPSGFWMTGEPIPNGIPDFNDPATKSCLIELARRRHGPTTTAIASLNPNTGAVTEWYVGNHQRVLCSTEDEIEAYVRALEIDP